jgi:deoxyadenosine/deoxycytidine kinase
VAFLREPVDIWATIQDKSGTTMLQKFYQDPKQYAFPFQIMAYATRLSLLREIIKNNPQCTTIICERSLDADQRIFAKMLFDDGMIDDINYQVYLHFFREYAEDYKMAGIVYVDSSPHTCYDRILSRAREGESEISMGYLTNCGIYHDEWLKSTNLDYPVLHIDANYEASFDPEDKDDIGNKWIEQISLFVQ